MSLTNSLKSVATKRVVPHLLTSLRENSDAFYRMLWTAVQLSIENSSPEEFRQALDEFYSHVDLPNLYQQLDFDRIKETLRRPKGYKFHVNRFDESRNDSKRGRFSPWARRFGLLARLGIHSDVLLLRRDQSIPPHGHIGVVSGFLVLEGQVRIRHYHRVDQRDNGLLLKPTIDRVLSQGEYTTNSEFCDDVHWLQGIADETFLFRTNVVGVKASRWEGLRETNDRLYVDPTGTQDIEGRVFAPFISGEVARELRMESCVPA